jgi:D-alanyl-D-alanine endopeptidase (penicillin-binding protein 7)
MNNAIVALGWTLVAFTWQGALIGVVAASLLALLRNGAPSQRYLVAGLALLACLLWPAIDLALRLAGGADGTLMPLAEAGDRSASGSAGWWQLLQSHLDLVVAAWLACMLALAARSALGLLWIARAEARGGRDAHWQAVLERLARQAGVARRVTLRLVDTLTSPITAGWWRPVVLVPSALLSGMPPELLEALLAHEVAHIRRHDYLFNLLQNVIEMVLFYHPVVWWLSHRIRHERELIADDLAASQSGQPRRLALALSELEKIQFAHHQLALNANGGDLMVRIQRLVRPQTKASNWKVVLPVVCLAVACVAGLANASDKKAAAGIIHPIVDFKSCAKPEWPQGALQAGHTGTVTLAFRIDANGKVTDSKVKNSSGHADLDQAAREGIQKCTFIPGSKGGKLVPTWTQMQYVWTLQ